MSSPPRSGRTPNSRSCTSSTPQTPVTARRLDSLGSEEWYERSRQRRRTPRRPRVGSADAVRVRRTRHRGRATSGHRRLRVCHVLSPSHGESRPLGNVSILRVASPKSSSDGRPSAGSPRPALQGRSRRGPYSRHPRPASRRTDRRRHPPGVFTADEHDEASLFVSDALIVRVIFVVVDASSSRSGTS